MKKLLYELPNEIIKNVYKFDDNIVNKNKFDKVIHQLNKTRIIEFVKYNIFDDNKTLYGDCKVSRMYIMDLLGDDDFIKYTDYNEKLDNYGTYKELMKSSNKYEIAKNFKNHKELYNIISNEYLNDEGYIEFFNVINEFKDWIIELGYFDKKVLKNNIFENWENSTDTDVSEYKVMMNKTKSIFF